MIEQRLKEILRLLRQRNRKLSCGFCKKKFASRYTKRRHEQMSCKGNPKREGKNAKSSNCPHCHCEFSRSDVMKRHLKRGKCRRVSSSDRGILKGLQREFGEVENFF